MRQFHFGLAILLVLLISCNGAEQNPDVSTIPYQSEATLSLNRLQYESSPYLLQHAGNPVDWWPWSDEAFELAKAENKPVIVSIGYSTCHWCHVMERESFEDEAVAAYMNEHFINIKVDREERPDVDQLYMEACQAITGNGGWPLNAFLLPDTRPFHAGTYFPPRSDGQRPGWLNLLKSIAERWQEKPEELTDRAEKLTQGIRDNSQSVFAQADASKNFSPEMTRQMVAKLKEKFDRINGGFGQAPKFPSVQSLELLLDLGILGQDKEAIYMVKQATEAMIEGGIYDQLGGGFSRYTVDAEWRIPHFEKMLYDNALLLRLMGKLQMLEPHPVFSNAIDETVNWLTAEMQSPDGTFYSALNADSEGKEGAFYVWKYAELKSLLSQEELAFTEEYFGLTEVGNFEEETNILYRIKSIPATAFDLWHTTKRKLLTIRDKRERPSRDDKVILQWNGLVISGLTYAYRATGKEAYRQLAFDAYSGLKNRLFADGKWHRSYKDDLVGPEAFLGDLTALNNARLDLYDLTHEPEFLLETEALLSEIESNFGDAAGGLYYLVPPDKSELAVAPLDLYDNAIPSGNGQMLETMRRLAAYTGKVTYRNQARDKLLKLVEKVVDYPTNFANYGRQMLLLQRPESSLVISGGETAEVANKILGNYRPGLAIVTVDEEREDIPSMKDRYFDGELQLYLCEDQTCRMPVGSIAELELD
ncbi:thioredoxin domain-containing protein [Lewinellaceae bacterium SD302]|nr:thioredoxin domain-containing protein [Lewinellaceae bacterium SD302]